MEIILASQSPRRKELLQRIVPFFTVLPADIEEKPFYNEAPKDYVERIATKKAATIAEKHANSLVIGCDTIVVNYNKILGKPKSKKQAFDMLKQLSGHTHLVYTSISLVKGEEQKLQTIKTAVTFYSLTDEEINQYLATNEYQDKAGAYSIQGQGALLVESIVGDYYGVVGLPIAPLSRMIEDVEKVSRY